MIASIYFNSKKILEKWSWLPQADCLEAGGCTVQYVWVNYHLVKYNWLILDEYQSRHQPEKTEEEVLVGHIDQLVIYPMRSTKGIKIDSAVAQEGGLQWKQVGDRTFRLIDAKNCVTLGCKLIPKLLKINLEIANDIIHFTITGLFKLFSSLVFTEY